MMHGPCGNGNEKSPCMVEGKCSKHFPKKFTEETSIDDEGFPVYRRRNNGVFVEKMGIRMDNSFVVPYNRDCIVKFQGHINVEWCNRSRSIKYLFKYINKGPDRAKACIQTSTESPSTSNQNMTDPDEIKSYLDCRYISAVEACWRIFQFDMFYRDPAVERLPFHLENEQTVIFNENDSLPEVAERPSTVRTKLTEWMIANANNEDARELTYTDFPTKWVWNDKNRSWTRRKLGNCIGRIYFAHPSSGEKYYLRMLLNVVKGSKSFANIRTVNNVVHPTFKSACYALGLLDDDREWFDCLKEASNWATGDQIRRLFATILAHCEVSNPGELWKSNCEILADGILHRLRSRPHCINVHFTEEEVYNHALIDIDQYLKELGKSVRDYDEIPMPDTSTFRNISNTLLLQEMNYDIRQEIELNDQYQSGLNTDQQAIYDAVINSVNEQKGKLIFVYGHGGTGKTFLWRAIIHKLRSESKIVLPVATSGIAALLLPGGRTAHSRFHIPLEINSESVCDIKQGTQLAHLIQSTDLIIWDEAPMTHKFCFEALDRSLRDILKFKYPNAENQPFGGITVVLGGDFRQILPVIPKGGKNDIIKAAINSSYLWEHFKVYRLHKNMRLMSTHIENNCNNSVAEFDKWLLQIGDGNLSSDEDDDLIELPTELLVCEYEDPITAIVNATYPNLLQRYSEDEYLQERAILAPKNDTVKEINQVVMEQLLEDAVSYYSSDFVCKASSNINDQDILYPTEFLNTLKFSGVPDHNLKLKVGVPVMLMRNINQSAGLCNGTRMVITHLGKWFVQARVFTGKNKGDGVLIPRITMTETDSRWPFKMKRRQLPLSVCFAMTINKSQGQSFKQVGLLLQNQVFAHGQLYVALSRVTSKNGLKILNADEETGGSQLIRNVVYHEIFSSIGTVNEM
ncbi:uncharacterized protein LOC130015063 [Mercurialis annua]|nr:uncharacterized protein LOC130015063 [Mercurialis annua]